MSLIHRIKNRSGVTVKKVPSTKGIARAYVTARDTLNLYSSPYISNRLNVPFKKVDILTPTWLLDSLKEFTYAHHVYVYTFIHATILKYLGERALPKLKILEIGCNYGAYIHFLKETYGVNVTGLDIDKDAASYANAAGLNIIAADAQALPFPDKSFDLVIANCFHSNESYIYEKRILDSDFQTIVMREIHRVLKPGGSYISQRTIDEDAVLIGDFSSCREISFKELNMFADPVFLLKK